MTHHVRGAQRLAVRNALIFDGSSPELIEGSILIVEGRVAELGARVGDADVELDARGNVVTPGLIDAHFHAYAVSLESGGIESLPLSYVALAALPRLGDALQRGFTTVRDPAGGDAGLGRAVEEGLLSAPRYFYTGAALSQTGGHGDYRSGDSRVCFHGSHTVELVDGVEPLRLAVRERFRTGAHAIKVLASGGVISPTDPLRVPLFLFLQRFWRTGLAAGALK